MRLFPLFYPFIFGNEICKKKLFRGEDCVQDFHSLGKFTTAFPWSYQADASTRLVYCKIYEGIQPYLLTQIKLIDVVTSGYFSEIQKRIVFHAQSILLHLKM